MTQEELMADISKITDDIKALTDEMVKSLDRQDDYLTEINEVLK